IIGEVSSSNTLAMVPVADGNKVLLFATVASGPKLTGCSKFFVRNWPSDLAEATQMADFAIDTLHIKKVAIIYVNNDYGLGLNGKFHDQFVSKGGTVTATEPYDLGSSDFRTIIQKIKPTGPDAVYISGYKELGTITRQLREARVNCQIVACTNYGD